MTPVMPPACGYITVAVGHTPLPVVSLWLTPPAPYVVVERPAAPPPPKQLTGWKQIVACSAKHGGPTSQRQLREIASNDPFCPIYAVDGVRYGSPVTAIDVRLIHWLETRRVPLAMKKLSTLGKKRRSEARL